MFRPPCDALQTARYGLVVTPLVEATHEASTLPGSFNLPSCAFAGSNIAPRAATGTSTPAVDAVRRSRL